MGDEEWWEAIFQLGKAHMWMDGSNDATTCFRRAKQGFKSLGNQEKTLEAAQMLAYQLDSDTQKIKEFRVLLQEAEETIGKNRVAYDIADSL